MRRSRSRHAVIRATGEALSASRCFLVEVSRDTGVAVVSLAWARDPADPPLPVEAHRLDELIPWELWSALGANPIGIGDVVTDPLAHETATELLEMGIASLAVAPHQRDGVLVAALVVTDQRARTWRDDELRRLAEAAGDIGPLAERGHADASLVSRLEQLERQARFLDITLATIADFAYSFDRDGRFLYTNQGLLDLLEITLPEIVGKTFHDLKQYPPDLAARLQRQVDHVVATGEHVVDETPFVAGDGSTRYYEYIFRPVLADDGRVEMVAGSTRDVTARTLAEEAVRLAGERDAFRLALADALRPLVDPVEIQTAAAQVIGEYLAVNHAYYGEAEADGEHLVVRQDYHHGVPSHAARYRYADWGTAMKEFLHAGRTLVVNDVAVEPGLSDEERVAYAGAHVAAHLTASLVKDARLVCVFGVRQAVPRRWTPDEVALVEETAERTWAAVERAQAEAALRESETRLRAIFDGTYEFIGLVSPAGTLLEANRASLEFVGLAREAVVGFPFWDAPWFVAIEGGPERMRAAVARAAAGEIVRYDDELRRPTGEVGMFDISLHPVRDEHGSVVLIVPEGRDITEQKRLERQKDDFLAIVSHELKTPVSSIKAFAQVMARRFRKAGDIDSATLVEKMDVQLNKLTGLIGDLLDATRIDSGQLRFRPESFDLDALLDEVVDDLQLTAEGQLIYREGGAGRTLVADRERTAQVVVNLLTNAIKFSPPESRIVVSTATDPAGVATTVRDEGRGIAPDHQAHVFDRFYRVSGPYAETFPGLGLGLHISAEFIRRQGGRIWVESRQGAGSTFGFWLPWEPRSHEDDLRA